MVNCTANDNVNIFTISDMSKILVCLCVWPKFLGGGNSLIVNVAHRDHVTEQGCLLGVASSLSPTTDERDPRAVTTGLFRCTGLCLLTNHLGSPVLAATAAAVFKTA